jgi:hypothetical protein
MTTEYAHETDVHFDVHAAAKSSVVQLFVCRVDNKIIKIKVTKKAGNSSSYWNKYNETTKSLFF